MANRNDQPSRTDRGKRIDRFAAAPEVTTAREQASPLQDGPDTGKLAEKGKKPQITLRNGAVVDARRAVAIVERLQNALEISPEEFRSLIALAENRPQDADPRHFEELKAFAFLDHDHSIRPLVRDLLLNSYQVTAEGPVVVPLRLKDAADLPAAQKAQRENDQFLRNILHRRKGSDDRSPD